MSNVFEFPLDRVSFVPDPETAPPIKQLATMLDPDSIQFLQMLGGELTYQALNSVWLTQEAIKAHPGLCEDCPQNAAQNQFAATKPPQNWWDNFERLGERIVNTERGVIDLTKMRKIEILDESSTACLKRQESGNCRQREAIKARHQQLRAGGRTIVDAYLESHGEH